MPKSTFWLGLLTILLAAACGMVVWHLAAAERTVPAGIVDGIQLGFDVLEADAGRAANGASAESTVWWDSEAGVMRAENNAFVVRPIASLTKLMTAMVALDHGIDWDQPVDILPEEYVIGGQLLLHSGEKVTMRDLFHASLLGSANNATLAYVRALHIPEEEFIREMNRKAIALGLEQTRFSEVTGLDTDNVSTAYEAARMAEAAFRDYPEIARVTSLHDYSFTVLGRGRVHTISNTNKLLSDGDMSFTGSKTGYLYEAGYCLVVRGADKLSRHIVVVLGAASERQSLETIKKIALQFD
ncbi:MAG: hypothetical protein COT71_00625 [Candidatus Andersenbacteria bacterium CG10_big_fil_rev_8_21_14_0_10_54_11]|uniref:Peptidase S11 D-alanyl-D-alanine carboxypeptidase A N-terminal domain-containing protein n=1 Tax=Candidatus Andersenbacteria bacterium CG10_big_fil_rev_8_21_14_0_10_54_11 TaxID=1974485 RepID=A0A2M6X076_9BACT|nr:MAG: hypothetical protein COT71_00625 [Candidatus Andersenbacteria bacterium CG10_big_fil_rev_8_21_14_0_10_54_11]